MVLLKNLVEYLGSGICILHHQVVCVCVFFFILGKARKSVIHVYLYLGQLGLFFYSLMQLKCIGPAGTANGCRRLELHI